MASTSWIALIAMHRMMICRPCVILLHQHHFAPSTKPTLMPSRLGNSNAPQQLETLLNDRVDQGYTLIYTANVVRLSARRVQMIPHPHHRPNSTGGGCRHRALQTLPQRGTLRSPLPHRPIPPHPRCAPSPAPCLPFLHALLTAVPPVCPRILPFWTYLQMAWQINKRWIRQTLLLAARKTRNAPAPGTRKEGAVTEAPTLIESPEDPRSTHVCPCPFALAAWMQWSPWSVTLPLVVHPGGPGILTFCRMLKVLNTYSIQNDCFFGSRFAQHQVGFEDPPPPPSKAAALSSYCGRRDRINSVPNLIRYEM